jgi:hypothetical protein
MEGKSMDTTNGVIKKVAVFSFAKQCRRKPSCRKKASNFQVCRVLWRPPQGTAIRKPPRKTPIRHDFDEAKIPGGVSLMLVTGGVYPTSSN